MAISKPITKTAVSISGWGNAITDEVNFATSHRQATTNAHPASAISNVPAGTIAATTVQNAINELGTEKAALAGAAFTGAVTVLAPTVDLNPATKKYADDAVALRAPLASPTFTGTVTVTTPTTDTSAATKKYVDDANALKAPINDPSFTGTVTVAGTPTAFTHAANGVIRSTGSPEGVVVASVGMKYIDVNATNGAIEWIKFSGTGNTGWRVMFGDTGNRNILPNIGAGFTATSLGIRRIGDRINLKWSDLQCTDGDPDGAVIYTPPIGFGVYGPDPANALGNLVYSINLVNLWSFAMTPNFRATKVLGGVSATAAFSGSLNYTASVVTGPWPTSLP